MKYMIIDNKGNYWCENGVSKEYAEAKLADLYACGEITEADEPEIVEVDD